MIKYYTESNTVNTSIYKKYGRTAILICLLLFAHTGFCQDSISVIQDSVQVKKNRKNTIKLNLTNPMLFGDNNYILGYESTIGKHQSFSLNLGTFTLGKVLNFDTDSIKGLNKDVNSIGLSMSCDYRFYLAKENKFNSPHGLYIGPYFSLNKFTRTYDIEATSASGSKAQLNADFMFRVATVGFQLGYQFVWRNRISLDMVLFGPGFSGYKAKVDLSTTLTPDQESEFFTKINEKLQERLPGYSLVVVPGTFEKTGSVNTTSMGYRYIVMLGFRF
jgi:hypothetical protein